MTDMRPTADEFAASYAGYVSLVPETDAVAVLDRQLGEVTALAASVPPARESFAYAAGKWTVREVFSHLVDSEHVFGYRAYCIGRGDRTPFPSFDESEYAKRSDAAGRPLADIAAEFALVRRANLAFLRRFGVANWGERGTASGKQVSARALAFIMTGHVRHHVNVLHERYRIGA